MWDGRVGNRELSQYRLMAPEPAGSGAPVGFYRHRIVASPEKFRRGVRDVGKV